MRLFRVLLVWFVLGYLCGLFLANRGYERPPILLVLALFIGAMLYYSLERE